MIGRFRPAFAASLKLNQPRAGPQPRCLKWRARVGLTLTSSSRLSCLRRGQGYGKGGMLEGALMSPFAGVGAFGVSGMTIVLLALGACSSSPPYVLPSPPSQSAVISGVKAAASEAKLTAPLEVSAVQQSDLGPGHHFICLREANPMSERRLVYAVFFNSEDYKGTRLSVIMEHCEAQAFSPIDLAPPAPPPKSGSTRKR
jgi:hypothetical protein